MLWLENSKEGNNNSQLIKDRINETMCCWLFLRDGDIKYEELSCFLSEFKGKQKWFNDFPIVLLLREKAGYHSVAFESILRTLNNQEYDNVAAEYYECMEMLFLVEAILLDPCMSKPKKMIVYNQVAGLYFKIQDMGLITDNESLFSTLNLVRSEMIYKALIKMISEVYPSADSNYYEGLLNVDGYNLKDTNIYDDDVFYPLYKNAQDLLQDAKYLQEKLDSNTLYEVLISDNDVFVRGILIIRTLFLKYVNMAVCDRYTLKLAGSQERISFNHTNKLQIDKVILDLIKLQHMKAGDYLEVHQLQLEEYINVSISTEVLIKSYNERCVNWPLELTDVIENNVSNVAFQRSNRTRKVMFIYNDTLEPVFPIDFNPEALKLVQDGQNPVIASPAVSNDVSFQVSPLYFYLPFCMILLWLLILLKKLF